MNDMLPTETFREIHKDAPALWVIPIKFPNEQSRMERI
jgi:hypothetical protein